MKQQMTCASTHCPHMYITPSWASTGNDLITGMGIKYKLLLLPTTIIVRTYEICQANHVTKNLKFL